MVIFTILTYYCYKYLLFLILLLTIVGSIHYFYFVTDYCYEYLLFLLTIVITIITIFTYYYFVPLFLLMLTDNWEEIICLVCSKKLKNNKQLINGLYSQKICTR